MIPRGYGGSKENKYGTVQTVQSWTSNFRSRLVCIVGNWHEAHLVKIAVMALLITSYRTESSVFPPNVGYLLRHANDRLSAPRHSP